MSGGSDHFDPFKDASTDQFAGLWSDLFGRVQPSMIAATASSLGAVLADALESVLPVERNTTNSNVLTLGCR